MTPALIRLEAARMRQRADALTRLARWMDSKEGSVPSRVLELSRDGVDAGTIGAIMGLQKTHVETIRAALRRRGKLGGQERKRFVTGIAQ